MDLSELNYKSIVENAKDIIIVTKATPLDEPGPEIVYANKAFIELTGFSSEEGLAKIQGFYNPMILSLMPREK